MSAPAAFGGPSCKAARLSTSSCARSSVFTTAFIGSACTTVFTTFFITGFAAVTLKASRDQPQARVLSKPFHLKDLVMEVERVLEDRISASL